MLTSLSEIEHLVGQPGRGAMALYRLPDQRVFTLVCQRESPLTVASACEALDGARGYAVVPFSPSGACPLVVIPPDIVRTCACPETPVDLHCQLGPAPGTLRADYARAFRLCHEAVRQARFDKLVLSRCAVYPCGGPPLRPLDLFLAACSAYPHQFIAVWDTPPTGSWLVATPEVLLSTDGGPEWRTMALAGTMDWNEQSACRDLRAWSLKNRREQRLVTDYLCERLDSVAGGCRVGRPYPVRAAGVAHLRTDIAFRRPADCTLSRLVRVLHPTPAVCGVPREEAGRFLMQVEGYERRYYAGFSGPLAPDALTALYVSLRCMRFETGRLYCYAGGGLLPESEEEAEWRETQHKMRTMLDLFGKQQ